MIRVLLLLLPAAPISAAVVSSVIVQGASLGVALETRAGNPLDQAAVSRDFRRLWDTGRLEDLRVEQTGPAEAPAIVFHAVEKRTDYLRDVVIEGERGPGPEVAPGTRIDQLRIHQAATALEQDLRRDGYRDVQVYAWTESADANLADLHLKAERGIRYRVDGVDFAGVVALDPGDLERALATTRPRTVLPGIWTRRPAYSEEAMEADLLRLRALYAKRGYFEATVAVAPRITADGRVRLGYSVDAGPRYDLGEIRLDKERISGDLCTCLFQARQKTWAEGRMDFDVRVQARESSPGILDLEAEMEAGPVFSVGRVEFHGHHSYSDATIRRVLTFAEGDPFDWNRVHQSLRRINGLELFEPITESAVRIVREGSAARITISLKQRPRGAWSLSGPLGPVSMGGPPAGMIASRLPKWGQGVLEASTYYLAAGATGLSPLAKLLRFAPKRGALFYFSIARPYLPGQEWRSGFTVSPQFGWKSALTDYGITQGRHRAVRLLARGTAAEPIAVPVTFGRRTVLLCEPPPPRWKWLRAAAGMAIDWVLPALL